MEDFWAQDLRQPYFPALERDMTTDVLIIGGGMAGILCALRLRQAGVDCLVAEGQTIGQGITRRTTGVLAVPHVVSFAKLTASIGKDGARRYLNANLRAVEDFGNLARRHPCDFERLSSVLYTLGDAGALRQEAAALQALGYDAKFGVQTPFQTAGAVRFPDQGQFHPLKFLYQAAAQLPVVEHTYIHRLDGTTAISDHGRIRANRVVVATHYPFVNFHGMYFMKLHQSRSHVIAYRGGPRLGCTLASASENGFFLRNYGDFLLVSDSSRRTGTKNPGFEPITKFVKTHFPQAEEVCRWGNQDCMTLDDLPYVGAYGKHLPNVFVATGFGGWGMTGSMVAAELLTDLLCGRDNPLQSILDPARTMAAGPLCAQIGESVLNMLTPTVPRCPHMGCALKWNPHEQSWDCPCHGSRLTQDGEILDNPAMRPPERP